MREALHVIDKEIVQLPYSASREEVANLKKLAKKELFMCPYCEALLIIKYGEQRGLYFSHLHSEACEESRIIEKAEKRYKKQIERETQLHRALIDIVFDELTIKSKINKNVLVNYGYKANPELKEYPDIWVKVNDKKYAISIVTNVSPYEDSRLAANIINRHGYYIEQGMTPIWFIEKKEQSIEKEKNSIILWDAELSISSKTIEDEKWDLLLKEEIQDEMFFHYFNYPVYSTDKKIDVRSLYYIFSNEDKITVKVQRILKDRIVKPHRALLLNEGYDIPFSEALVIEDGFKLSNPEIENELRNRFKDYLIQKKKQHEEQKRREEELRKAEEEQKYHRMKEMEQARKSVAPSLENITYNDLKVLLRKKIGLTQPEQMDLWTRYMPAIRYNSKLVLDLVVKYDCKTFNELKVILNKIIKLRQ
ncbi:competence protein CoiA family protein [Schinkia sp. CFF1]